mgnify:CR=1 FL=1
MVQGKQVSEDNENEDDKNDLRGYIALDTMLDAGVAAGFMKGMEDYIHWSHTNREALVEAFAKLVPEEIQRQLH